MKAIDRNRATELLRAFGIDIGEWNELRSIANSTPVHVHFPAPIVATELYVATHCIAQWVKAGAWTILQVDNSTFPTPDEAELVRVLTLENKESWDHSTQPTLLLDGMRRDSEIIVLIYFSMLFEWHVHLASDGSARRVALQDGVVYFFGSLSDLQAAEALITRLHANPNYLHQQ